jgi:hypothetical protein
LNSYEKGFSRIIFNKGLLRKTALTANCVAKQIKKILQHFPLAYSACPGCNSPLHKHSACNDLYHCGNRNICNFCNYTSFPWENGIPSEHWKSCFRWDSEVTTFLCREGVCFTENIECKEHSREILKYNKKKLLRSCQQLKEDVGNEKYFQALEILKKENLL